MRYSNRTREVHGRIQYRSTQIRPQTPRGVTSMQSMKEYYNKSTVPRKGIVMDRKDENAGRIEGRKTEVQNARHPISFFADKPCPPAAAVFVNGMVIIVREKILYAVAPAESAFFVERYGFRGISGTHLQNGIYCHCQFVLMACTQLSHR